MGAELDEVVDHLESARESTRRPEVEARLADVIDQFERAQGKPRGPDAGRIARLSNSLREIREETESTRTSVALDRAHVALRSYEP